MILAALILGSAVPPAGEETPYSSAETCDVEGIHEAVSPSAGTLAINDFGEVVKVQTILSPVALESGTYEVSVSQEQSNLYKLDGENVYIKTTYCSSMALAEEAILKVKSGNGYTVGQLIFPDSY